VTQTTNVKKAIEAYGDSAVGHCSMTSLLNALAYVSQMTHITPEGEWTLKPGYDPKVVLDALDSYDPTS
jgi:hypothetical protein